MTSVANGEERGDTAVFKGYEVRKDSPTSTP